jgi:hypothetical protein
MPRFATSTATPGAGASATPDFGVEGWEPFDDVQLVNGITAAAGWIDMAVDPSLEIAGLSEEGWEEMACFEIVSDATDYVNTNGKVSRSARVVRDRILQAQRQFGMTSAALTAFERDANPQGRQVDAHSAERPGRRLRCRLRHVVVARPRPPALGSVGHARASPPEPAGGGQRPACEW